MNRRSLVCISGLAAAAVLSGCGSLIKQRTPPVQYYQLDYAAPARSAPVSSALLLVRPFRISPAYDRDAITYTDINMRAGLYTYSQWIASPEELVTARIVRDLQASGLLGGVLAAGAGQQPDFILHGLVEELGEHRTPTGTFGVVTLTCTLTRERRGLPARAGNAEPPVIVFQRSYTARQPCEPGQPASLAAAVSAALQNVSAQLQADVAAAARDAGW